MNATNDSGNHTVGIWCDHSFRLGTLECGVLEYTRNAAGGRATSFYGGAYHIEIPLSLRECSQIGVILALLCIMLGRRRIISKRSARTVASPL